MEPTGPKVLKSLRLDVGAMRRLKRSLEGWQGGRPPLLLRRLKEDSLPELPRYDEVLTELVMPAEQATAYQEVIATARGAARKGAALEALQLKRWEKKP